MKTTSITAEELAKLHTSGKSIDLIDVRTPIEYQEVHVTFARNIPLDSLQPQQIIEERESKEDPLYVICQSGKRGMQACAKFHAVGFTNVINIDGGTLTCKETDLPIALSKEVMSLERQVRIAAGTLVLIGVFLGWFVHPGFIFLSAFVGAGLVFAGITDTCGMGLMLAKMPWNNSDARRPLNS